MSGYIYGVVNTIIYTLMCNMFGSVLLDRGRKKRNYTLLMIFWIITEYGASAVLDHYVVSKMCIVIILDIVFLKCIYQSNAVRTIGTACLYQAICVLTEYLNYIMARKVMKDIDIVSGTDAVTWYLLGTLSQIILIFFVFWFRNHFGAERQYVLVEQEWVKFITVPIFSMITIFAFIVNFEGKLTQGQENTILFVVFGLALMNIFVFYLILDIIKRETERKQEELVLEHAEQTEKLYLQEKKKYEELQSQRHEYRNQMMVIQALLEKGEHHRIEEYIRANCGEMEQTGWFETNNSVVNAVLNLKYTDALKKKILIVLRFNDLADIPMEDKDIISVLSNLLDNAIEAGEKCEGKTPLIKVKFVVENGRMLLAVSNTWNGKLVWRDGKIVSSKEDGKTHGYGMDNVKRIVRKYRGSCIINTEEEEFKVVVSVPIC